MFLGNVYPQFLPKNEKALFAILLFQDIKKVGFNLNSYMLAEKSAPKKNCSQTIHVAGNLSHYLQDGFILDSMPTRL